MVPPFVPFVANLISCRAVLSNALFNLTSSRDVIMAALFIRVHGDC